MVGEAVFFFGMDRSLDESESEWTAHVRIDDSRVANHGSILHRADADGTFAAWTMPKSPSNMHPDSGLRPANGRARDVELAELKLWSDENLTTRRRKPSIWFSAI